MDFILNMLKGISIGVANVIPGVSGGTLAVITGIFERLVNAIKSIDLTAVKLFFTGRFREFSRHIDFWFLAAIGSGMVIAIFTAARLFDFLFNNYPVYIWAFFFGLIVPSVYFVAKTVGKWRLSVIIAFIAGTLAALALIFLSPAVENANPVYVFICGAISITAMILPGISGSFVLILLGNYQLVAIDSINKLDLSILIPFGLGCAAGLAAFARLLAFVMKKFRDQTISTLSGFVLGSLIFVWPWKKPVFALDSLGNILQRKGENVVMRYDRFLPSELNQEVQIAIVCALIGAAIIIIIEKAAAGIPESKA